MRFFLLLTGAISVLANECVGKVTKDSCHEASCIYDENKATPCYDPCQEHQTANDDNGLIINDKTLNTTFSLQEGLCVDKGCVFDQFSSEDDTYTCALPCSSVCKGEEVSPVCACTRDYVSKCMALCSGFFEGEIRMGVCDDVYITDTIEQICKDNNAFPNWYTIDTVFTNQLAKENGGICPDGPHGVYCVKPSLIMACPNSASEDTLVCAALTHQTYQFSNPCMAIGAGFTQKDLDCTDNDECPHGDCDNDKCLSEQGHYYVKMSCDDYLKEDDYPGKDRWIPAYVDSAMANFGTSPKSSSIAIQAGSPYTFNVLYFNESDDNLAVSTEGLEPGCGCDHNLWRPVCLVTGLLSFTFPNNCVADCRRNNQKNQWSQVYWPTGLQVIDGECSEPCVGYNCEEGEVCASQGETVDGKDRHVCVPEDQDACNDACFQIATAAIGGLGKVLCDTLFTNFVQSTDSSVGDYCASAFSSKKRCPSGCEEAPADSVAICVQTGDDQTPCRATISSGFDQTLEGLFQKGYGNDKVCVSQWLRKDTEWFYSRNKCQAIECLGFYSNEVFEGPCDQRCVDEDCTADEKVQKACVYSNSTQERQTVTLCDAKCRTDEFTAYYEGICAVDDCIKTCPLSMEGICIRGTISQNSVCEALCAGLTFEDDEVTEGLCDIIETFDCELTVEGETPGTQCCDLLSTELSVDEYDHKCSDYKQGSGKALNQFCTDQPSSNAIQILRQDGYDIPDDVTIAIICPFSCNTCVEQTSCSETNIGCCDLVSPRDIKDNNGINAIIKTCKSYKQPGPLAFCVKDDDNADEFTNNLDDATDSTYAYGKFERLMAVLRPEYENHYFFQKNKKLLARHVCRESCGQCACHPLIPGCCDIVLRADTSYMVSEQGDCQSYQAGGINEGMCEEHDALSRYQSEAEGIITVSDVCRVSCNSCFRCVPNATECCNIKEEFRLTTAFEESRCSAYAPGQPNHAYCTTDKLKVNGVETDTLISDVCQIECNKTCKVLDRPPVDPCTDSPYFVGHENSGCAGYVPGGKNDNYCFSENACSAESCECPLACLKDPESIPYLPSQCRLPPGSDCSDDTFACAGNNFCFEGTCQELVLGKCEDNPVWKGNGGGGCSTYAPGRVNAGYCVEDGACVNKTNCQCPESCQDEKWVLDVYPELEAICAEGVERCKDKDDFLNRWTTDEDGFNRGCDAYKRGEPLTNFEYCTQDRVIKHGRCPITCENPECVILNGQPCGDGSGASPEAVCKEGLSCGFYDKCVDPNVEYCKDYAEFDGGYGGCDTYKKGKVNHDYCLGDGAYLQGACPVACENTDCVFPECDKENPECCDKLGADDKFYSETAGCGDYGETSGNRDYCDKKTNGEGNPDMVQEIYLASLPKIPDVIWSTDLTAGDVCPFSCGYC